ncbi:MAG TPA: prepilin-type N-terminal cleavage/methylation domain-containing protein [Fimbriimonas sp.]|nr:prepilin-type N-terminal cleavage/methylation domain-containing protein [Fimbriimonas sp.]
MNSKKAFTLIELLVVIAIIAILAAILFPVFAQAKTAAKKTQDLSNMKQMGTGTQLYIQDFDDTYGQAYYYKDDLGDTGGYWQWTGTHYPYIKNMQMFVSPGDPSQGLPPTNPPCTNISDGVINYSAPCDSQVPRISYTVNAAVMPRKRKSTDVANVTSATAIDPVAETILISSFSNTASCVNDTSQNQTTTGYKNKSHRPTNAYMTTATGGKWAGDNAADRDIPAVYAVTTAIAKAAWDFCKTGADSSVYPHIKYIQGDRFGNGSNYAFADGHAKFMTPDATFNPNRFLWGKQVFTMGNKPVLDQAGVQVR